MLIFNMYRYVTLLYTLFVPNNNYILLHVHITKYEKVAIYLSPSNKPKTTLHIVVLYQI